MLALGILLTVVAVAESLAAASANALNVEQEPRYDPAKVVNILGTVADIREVAYPGPLSGLHLAVKADAGTIDTYLGPMDFLKGFEVTFAKGDRIQVVGSKVKFRGSDVVLAREVSRDGTILYLRDAQGRPYWENQSSACQRRLKIGASGFDRGSRRFFAFWRLGVRRFPRHLTRLSGRRSAGGRYRAWGGAAD